MHGVDGKDGKVKMEKYNIAWWHEFEGSMLDFLNGLDKQIETLQSENTQLRNAQKWHDAREELPEVDEYGDINVLVCMDDGFITTATYDKNNGWELWADAGEVTHWMQLPTAPDAQTKEEK